MHKTSRLPIIALVGLIFLSVFMLDSVPSTNPIGALAANSTTGFTITVSVDSLATITYSIIASIVGLITIYKFFKENANERKWKENRTPVVFK